ncbi:protein of unknown function [Pararobbsia alpina]
MSPCVVVLVESLTDAARAVCMRFPSITIDEVHRWYEALTRQTRSFPASKMSDVDRLRAKLYWAWF